MTGFDANQLRISHHGLSEPARRQQVEPDRTPPILVYKLELERKPLMSYETVLNLIGGTITKTGLKVKAILDTNYYETG
jgi:hypothetical protein